MKCSSATVDKAMARRNDRQYLLKRYAQESELASAARDAQSAALHASMAAEYERRLAEMLEPALFANAHQPSDRGSGSASS